MSLLLYGCTIWTLTKPLEKKLNRNYKSMMHAILNKSWKHHSSKQQLYSHLPPISQNVQIRRTRQFGKEERAHNRAHSMVFHTCIHQWSAQLAEECRIHWLHLYRKVITHLTTNVLYMTLKIWCWDSSNAGAFGNLDYTLLLLPGSHRPGVVTHDRILSMGQIELFGI